MSNEFVIIPKSEREIAKGALVLTEVDLEKLIENKELLVKFLTKSIHKYQANHGQFLDVGKEAETYIAINTIKGLIESLDNTYEEYKKEMAKRKK